MTTDNNDNIKVVNSPTELVHKIIEDVAAKQERNLQEALDMLQGYTMARDITRVDRLKVAVCGDKKSGKSCLVARTARKPLLVYDFDDRRESIAGIENVIVKTLIDMQSSMPSAWGKFETDIGMLEYLKSQGKLPFRSIALDSISFLRQYAENQMMKDTNANLRKNVIGLQTYLIAQGWDSINYTRKMISEAFRRLFTLDVDVYAIFHTKNEKDYSKSTKDNTVYTGKLTVEPQNLNELLSIFNEVWRAYIDENNNFKLQLKPDYYFTASTALNNQEAVEDQDIQKMLDKHNSKV